MKQIMIYNSLLHSKKFALQKLQSVAWCLFSKLQNATLWQPGKTV